MDFLRRLERCSRLENVIRETVNIKNSVLNYVRYQQLNWYGHVQRMNEERLPRKKLKLEEEEEEEKEDLEIRGCWK